MIIIGVSGKKFAGKDTIADYIIEKYGFVKQYDQYTNVIRVSKPFPERFSKIADWIANKPEYRFVHFENKHFKNFLRCPVL